MNWNLAHEDGVAEDTGLGISAGVWEMVASIRKWVRWLRPWENYLIFIPSEKHFTGLLQSFLTMEVLSPADFVRKTSSEGATRVFLGEENSHQLPIEHRQNPEK